MRPQIVPPQPTPGSRSPGAAFSGLVDPFEVTLASVVGAPAAARAAVTAWMAGHVSESMLGDAQLLVAELVANSVRHADKADGAVISVRAWLRAGVVCLEVQDPGSSGSISRREPDMKQGGGFGLNIVDAVAARWGVNRGAGTRVWVELAVPANGGRVATDTGPAMQSDRDETAEVRPDAAGAAQRRASKARRRAVAAREAAERATTEYARRAHDRAADVHAQLAVSHEDYARTLRSGRRDAARR
jgi:serine/threonine-protein kinase RsbW